LSTILHENQDLVELPIAQREVLKVAQLDFSVRIPSKFEQKIAGAKEIEEEIETKRTGQTTATPFLATD